MNGCRSLCLFVSKPERLKLRSLSLMVSAQPSWSSNRSMKIYTKTGDAGKTSLYSGERVLKTDRRFEALGSIDELSSWIGMCRIHAAESQSLRSEIFVQV